MLLEQNGDFAKKPHMSARIGVKLLGGLLGVLWSKTGTLKRSQTCQPGLG